MTEPTRMPTLFLPHGGGPCFFMDWNPPHIWDSMAAFLRGLTATLPVEPRAILIVSGHWETPVFTVNSGAQPPLLFDYYGFPAHTYQLTYPAPGDPAIAERVRELLAAAGLDTASDAERGYDHGVFVPFKVAFPEARIPIVQLSLLASLDPAEHLAAGRALAPLRDEGVLIVGSGMSYHNLRGFGPNFTGPSEQFDAWLTGAVGLADAEERCEALTRWEEAPHAHTAHPKEGHLIPLMVAAGAAEGDAGRSIFRDHVMDVAISAYRFG